MRTLCALLVTAAVLTASDYAPVKSWAGSGGKETESFDIAAKEWRLRWTAKPIDPRFAGSGVKAFSVQVLRGDSDLPVSTFQAGPSETAGESYVRGTGRFYLKITAVNAQWTLAAEQAQ